MNENRPDTLSSSGSPRAAQGSSSWAIVMTICWWLAGNIVAWAFIFVMLPLVDISLFAVPVLAAVFGVTQWIAIQRVLDKAWRWVLFTAVAGTLGLLLAILVGNWLGASLSDASNPGDAAWMSLLALILVWLPVGLAQGYLLSPASTRSPAYTTALWTINNIVAALVALLVFQPRFDELSAIPGAAAGLVYGVITTLALMYLLRDRLAKRET